MGHTGTLIYYSFLFLQQGGWGQTGAQSLVTGIARTSITNFLLDTEESIVLGHPLASGWSTSLDLAGTESDDEVGDEGIFGLA